MPDEKKEQPVAEWRLHKGSWFLYLDGHRSDPMVFDGPTAEEEKSRAEVIQSAAFYLKAVELADEFMSAQRYAKALDALNAQRFVAEDDDYQGDISDVIREGVGEDA